MATKHKLDSKDPHYKEGRRMALELKHEHILAEAKRAADERKRVRDPPHTSKRDSVGRGKPRGRRGGRRHASATATYPTFECSLSSSVEVPFTATSTKLNPQEEFEKNMERLSDILASCPSAGQPQSSSASSWSFRQQKASERWKEARPYHLKCLISKEAVGHPLCGLCNKPAVIRCRECLPEEWFCGDCDVLHHKKQPLHNRECVIRGFFEAIPPTTCIIKGEAGYCTHEQACTLPTVKMPDCSCGGTNFTVLPGKPVILITINGRFDLHQPLYECQTCQQQWTPDFKDLLRSGYWPASITNSTLYTLDLLSSLQELKIISPGFSRQAFAKLLEHRTKCGGRSGPINGDALQRSFLELSYASFEEDQLCCGAPFTCPACTPEMLAVSADGNRKLYRFRRNGSSDDPGFFEGLFVAEDSVVSRFVDTIQKAVKNTQGRGTCGDSQWTAARETSRRASKLDEEGMEVAVCRHGFLLKALNMYRGEIFAYPLYLQKELMPAKAQFFAMDVACKYWPYLEKVASVLPALQELTTMKPFLSVMHARAHATKCEINWSGRNQEGAGTTAEEEVEQVNSYLSRCALTTKYMSKAARVDMLTLHAMGWNEKKNLSLHQALSTRYVKTCQRLHDETARLADLKTELDCTDELVSQWLSDVKEWAAGETPGTSRVSQGTTHKEIQQSIEGLYLSVRHRKRTLYCQNDSSKFRHRLRRKLAEDKKLLLQEIQKYNDLVLESATTIDVAVVEHSLTGENTVSQIWPWEVHGSANISIKKRVHDQVMLTRRLHEETRVLVLEMAQHCTWLQSLAMVLNNKLAEEDQGNEGLCCLLRRRLSEVSERFQMVLQQYKTALGPEASVLLHVEEEDQSDLSSPDTSEDEEENTI
ncbi:uncharacterized protein LOC113097471 isoform X2 [Carassius auratus]|uniref:Uncharacterized protein LOC113076207 isoform X2 n=1 Tax=Carassius auratus TaxID=7957 RepID=A0A6P6PBP9_CARAU|nr:uncharacterized protein LOC113076207 isoform X2 [Carassius auratus]XP_026118483.1 uncharacterized protein LOC113097471 isoform X2 [Carassius auratus]